MVRVVPHEYLIYHKTSRVADCADYRRIYNPHSRQPIHLMLKFHSVFVSGVIIIMIFTRRRLRERAGGGEGRREGSPLTFFARRSPSARTKERRLYRRRPLPPPPPPRPAPFAARKKSARSVAQLGVENHSELGDFGNGETCHQRADKQTGRALNCWQTNCLPPDRASRSSRSPPPPLPPLPLSLVASNHACNRIGSNYNAQCAFVGNF